MAAIFYWAQPERIYIRPIQLRSQLRLVSADAVVSWIHCARVGRWKGHAQGEFEFTIEDLKHACVNFAQQQNAIPLTYDHPIADGARAIEKAGWVHDLRMRGAELYALCEFTAKAVQLNRDGSYKFCSISFNPDGTDRESGEPIGMEINEIGLTDSPFIDALEPIRLSRHATASGGNMAAKQAKRIVAGAIKLGIDVSLITDALSQLEGDVTPERVHALVEAEILRQQAISGEDANPKPKTEDEMEELDIPSPPKDLATTEPEKKLAAEIEPTKTAEPPAEVTPESGEMMSVMEALMKESGMDMSSMLAALRDKAGEIATILKGTSSSDSMVGMARELEIAKKQLSVLVSERDAQLRKLANESATIRVSELIKTGRVLEADRREWMALAIEAPDRFTKLASTITPAVPTGMLTGPGTGQREQDVSMHDPGERSIQVRQLRQVLSAAGLSKTAQDEHINKTLAQLRAGDAE